MEHTEEILDDFTLAFDAAATDVAPLEEPPPIEEPKVEAAPIEELPPVEEVPAEIPPVEEPKVETPPVVAAPPVAPVVEAPPAPAGPSIEEIQAARAVVEQPTAEESTVLQSVEADFPEIHQALKIHMRLVEAKLAHQYEDKLKALTEEFNTRIAPALNESEQSARSRHETIILTAHPDALAVLPKVDEWVKSKPAFMQPAFDKVLDSGSAHEIVDLLALFKKETGAVAPTIPPKEEPVATDPEKEQRLMSQEGVRGRTVTKKGGIDTDDFESAFNQAAAIN